MPEKLILSSSYFTKITGEERERIASVLGKWVEAFYLEKKDFSLSGEGGLPLDLFVKNKNSIESFIEEIEKQTVEIIEINQWLEKYPNDDQRFFALMEYLYKRKGKEEIVQNLLHQNVDREWIEMITGFTQEEIERVYSNTFERS